MIWLGIAIVIFTFWLIYKNFEARLVLFLSGIAMTILGVLVGGSSVGLSAQLTLLLSNSSMRVWCRRTQR